MNNVLDFFHWRHQNNVNAKTLLHYRGALKWVVNSSAHSVLDNVLISRYISGLFNLFPQPPRMPKEIWDVNDVLAYWDRLPPSTDLPLMLLSQKTVLLILISTMRRPGELLFMSIDNLVYAPNSITFPLDAYPKTYSLYNPNEQLRFITIRKFPENRNICPMSALQVYLKRTAPLRTTVSKKLFITTQHPFRPVARMTLRRWILTGLSDAGVDVSKYTAKTTRHASSSKAYFAGVSIDTVMLRAGWNNVSSFVTHYNLPVISRTKNQTVSSRLQSPISSVRRSHFRLSSACGFKTAKNVRAQKILELARQSQFKKAVTLQNMQDIPFASPPPKVQRVILDKPVRVEIPGSTLRKGTRTPGFKGRKKPYVTYTTSVPVLQVASLSQVSRVSPSHVPNDDSLTE